MDDVSHVVFHSILFFGYDHDHHIIQPLWPDDCSLSPLSLAITISYNFYLYGLKMVRVIHVVEPFIHVVEP